MPEHGPTARALTVIALIATLNDSAATAREFPVESDNFHGIEAPSARLQRSSLGVQDVERELQQLHLIKQLQEFHHPHSMAPIHVEIPIKRTVIPLKRSPRATKEENVDIWLRARRAGHATNPQKEKSADSSEQRHGNSGEELINSRLSRSPSLDLIQSNWLRSKKDQGQQGQAVKPRLERSYTNFSPDFFLKAKRASGRTRQDYSDYTPEFYLKAKRALDFYLKAKRSNSANGHSDYTPDFYLKAKRALLGRFLPTPEPQNHQDVALIRPLNDPGLDHMSDFLSRDFYFKAKRASKRPTPPEESPQDFLADFYLKS
ncbi:hypothetical protein TCAL_09281 [Tigriopus californicus]|uniref:Uncharacterized protein n=1 Tax=Tigriopus californicus TaxID=6832 RepID=A0A553PU08_TIGCA|nr:uncharacterized protein LOC131891337 [Tigriopus californicus]TRY81165.1 hypothetical protein TCAL_09281 [Tigriopus californicus]|eukprot:TCALIF_09281-PA protein Name:"Protein of unknown function" AED:0.00 eAED:0.00 QI:72/1/1/1/1/1/3/497/316